MISRATWNHQGSCWAGKALHFFRGLLGYGLVDFDVTFCVFNICFFSLQCQYEQMKHVFFSGTHNSRSHFCVTKQCRIIRLQQSARRKLANVEFTVCARKEHPPAVLSPMKVRSVYKHTESYNCESSSGLHTISINEWTSTWSQK
jgi:hypothetical protein